MSEDGSESPKIAAEPSDNEVLKRQTTAGIAGEAPLSQTEQMRIRQINARSFDKSPPGEGPIPPEINVLLKKQANAGTPGNPDLNDSERETLREFYKKRA